MPDGRCAGAMSVEGFGAGGGFDAAPLTARSSTAGVAATFGATLGAGFAATRAVTLLGLVFFTAPGFTLGRDVERAREEERVERAGWAISPRAYHCPRSGVNGDREYQSSSSRLGSFRPVRRASG